MFPEDLKQQLDNDFSLVLSGGGALGIAHLNVLHYLDSHEIKPQEILGVSMGAIIGSAYALDNSEQDIYQLIKQFSNIFKWGKLSFSNGSLLATDKIRKLFEQIYGQKKISDTNIPLKLVATDFNTGTAQVFDQTSNVAIVDAVLASMAIPGIFPPVTLNNKILVDGFIASNLPVEFASHEIILASDVLGKHSFQPFQEKDYQFFGHTRAVLEMLERTLRLVFYNKTKTIIQKHPGVILIEPDVSDFKTFEFHKYDAIIKRSRADLI
jgi:NTE family protein